MSKLQEISSADNPSFKNWKKLISKRGRQKFQAYLVEGFHLVEEALQSKQEVQTLLLDSSKEEALEFWHKYGQDVPAVQLPQALVKDLAGTQTSQGIFAVVKASSFVLDKAMFERPYLLVDSVQDPGNLGTLIRTADAAGFEGIVLGSGTVDPYNDKTLRSAQGSHFHLPIFQNNLSEALDLLKSCGYQVYGTDLNEMSQSYKVVQPSERFALIVGNEGQGVTKDLLELTDSNLHIPMRGQAESLNVAIAASILIFSLTPIE